MNFNFHWPQTKYNNRVPWYTILRRAVFYVPAFATLFVFLWLVYLGWGHQTVKDLWDEIV